MKGTITMNEEIKTLVSTLNGIQRNALRGSITKEDRAVWRSTWDRLHDLGYTGKKRKVRNAWGGIAEVVWSAVPKVEREKVSRNTECEFIPTDVRPKDRKTLKGDCTTRAMAYCLNGVMTYDEIERRQYELAAKRHTRRNSNGTWDIVLVEHEYVKVRLARQVKRSVLARMLAAVITHPVVSHSSGHVAVIDKDGVHDTWDSRGGRCDALHAFKDDIEAIRRLLEGRGIGTVVSQWGF
jgi:hypothetical protein